MKKRLFVLFLLFFLCACQKKESIPTPTQKKEENPSPVIDTYQDLNTTPISFYELKGNTLKRVHEVSGPFQSLDDIGLFQIYPSLEEEISLEEGFASSFQKEWLSYYQKSPIRMGFSLSFQKQDGEKIHYNILTPNNTMDHWEYFMAYLYDDYANLGKSSYSHMEMDDYSDSSLFTAIKLQCGGNCRETTSPIEFRVFTYDGEDDFLDGVYRGNSQSSIMISIY